MAPAYGDLVLRRKHGDRAVLTEPPSWGAVQYPGGTDAGGHSQRQPVPCVCTGMSGYGPATSSVDQLIRRAAHLTLDEVADIYDSHAARILIHGPEAQRRALARARRAAAVAGLEPEYLGARHDAAAAWRHALPDGSGPWLLVGQAIVNAAGALVVYTSLDEKELQLLVGPWRQAIGSLEPVGPGLHRALVSTTAG